MICQKSSNKQTRKSFITKSNGLGCINPNVAGLDIGASSIFACAGSQNNTQEVREFSAFTVDLKALIVCLNERGIRNVAMESTGVYWIPVYDLLAESGFEVLLVNAHHLKSCTGKKNRRKRLSMDTTITLIWVIKRLFPS